MCSSWVATSTAATALKQELNQNVKLHDFKGLQGSVA